MSARMQIEPANWEGLEAVGSETAGRKPSEVEVECLFRNFEQRNLVAPLREVHAGLAQVEAATETAEAKRQAALSLQEQWNAWLTQRDLLTNEIKRGKELLDQVRRELAVLRAHLEEWPAYERICGKNPLPDYAQTIAAKERIEQFLPDWLERRQEQWRVLTRKMELCAKQNGLEHLL